VQRYLHLSTGVARGVSEAMPPTKFLENIVILCFERRFFKQNSVIRLKSSILAPPNFAPPKFLGWLRHYTFPSSFLLWRQEIDLEFSKYLELRGDKFRDLKNESTTSKFEKQNCNFFHTSKLAHSVENKF